jgi:hypothetical protein
LAGNALYTKKSKRHNITKGTKKNLQTEYRTDLSPFYSIFGIEIMAVWMVLLSSGWHQLSQGTSHCCPTRGWRAAGLRLEDKECNSTGKKESDKKGALEVKYFYD